MRHFLLATCLAFCATLTYAQTFPLEVDSCGQKLRFDAPPKRAVIHDLNMTEMALALQLNERLVGVTGITGWYKTEPEFKAALGKIPELAPKYPTLENLLAVDLDFFFAGWNYGMKVGGDVTPESLKKYNVKTLVLSESCIHVDKKRPVASMDLLYRDFTKLGTIFGKEQQAKTQVQAWKDRLAKIKPTTGQAPRIFLYDSGEDKPFTAGKFAIVHAMMNAAGGRNIMSDMETSWGTTSWETVASRDPEFLILLDYQDGHGVNKLLDFLRKHPAMRETAAVKNNRYVALRYAELTPGPANIEAIEKMAAGLLRMKSQ